MPKLSQGIFPGTGGAQAQEGLGHRRGSATGGALPRTHPTPGFTDSEASCVQTDLELPQSGRGQDLQSPSESLLC